MRSTPLSRGLGAGVAAVAVLGTLSGLSTPLRDHATPPGMAVLGLAILLAHATLYWYGPAVRARFGMRGYAGAQATALTLIGFVGLPGPVVVGLFMAGMFELVSLVGRAWGTMPIVVGAIALYVTVAAVTAGLYRATTAGLLLAAAGVVAHSASALARRRSGNPGPAAPVPAELSAREAAVLRELARGARNTEIAETLGIAERTVKAHLGSIYRKLGVESRSAAVALALQRKLV